MKSKFALIVCMTKKVKEVGTHNTVTTHTAITTIAIRTTIMTAMYDIIRASNEY